MTEIVEMKKGILASIQMRVTQSRKGESGVTLVELMMTIAISSIIGAMVLTSVFLLSTIVTRMTERTEDFIDAKHALDEISVNMRSATNADQGRGRLTDAKPFAVIFYTSSGKGLLEKPQLMGYFSANGALYHLVAGPDNNFDKPVSSRTVITGIEDNNIFEFYTWADPKKTPGNKCFRKLTDAELSAPPKDADGNIIHDPSVVGDAILGRNARDSIAGVKISFKIKKPNNARFKDSIGHTTWVRLGESIEPKDPITGALIPGWPEHCWEVFGD